MSIFRRHRDGRLDLRQTASRRSGQYRGGGGLFIRELSNNQPIMVAEGQVSADEPASYALEEFGNGFLAIFWLSQHALSANEACLCGRTPVTTRISGLQQRRNRPLLPLIREHRRARLCPPYQLYFYGLRTSAVEGTLAA